jgi:hypothetical protein
MLNLPLNPIRMSFQEKRGDGQFAVSIQKGFMKKRAISRQKQATQLMWVNQVMRHMRPFWASEDITIISIPLCLWN